MNLLSSANICIEGIQGFIVRKLDAAFLLPKNLHDSSLS